MYRKTATRTITEEDLAKSSFKKNNRRFNENTDTQKKNQFKGQFRPALPTAPQDPSGK
ncbi:hypothetical protein CHS0354_009188, partial [Potamilus streckersoni]